MTRPRHRSLQSFIKQEYELLTIDEAASIARKSPQALYRLIRIGQFPALRLGNQYRVPVRGFRNWLDSWRQQ
jgi:excisionase family DNA binding protein